MVEMSQSQQENKTMSSSRIPNAIIAAVVAAVVAVGVSRFSSPAPIGAPRPAEKGTLERVLSSGVIRCGYVVYPPNLIVDLETKKVSGIFPEVLEKAAENLGLKVEWSEEVAWGTMIEGLQAGRYDLIGSPVWPTGQRVRVADFTEPLHFNGVEMYVRVDDSRFDAGIEVLNDPKFTIATIDGEAAASIAQEDFPQAKTVSLPQLSGLPELMLNLSARKADATFVDSITAQQFIIENPGKIKPARPGVPVRLFANEMMLKQSDDAFRRALDAAITDLHNNGVVDQITKKYEPFPGAYYRVARPFQKPKAN
jgi:polar amino acid transport system substrate-binding protein